MLIWSLAGDRPRVDPESLELSHDVLRPLPVVIGHVQGELFQWDPMVPILLAYIAQVGHLCQTPDQLVSGNPQFAPPHRGCRSRPNLIREPAAPEAPFPAQSANMTTVSTNDIARQFRAARRDPELAILEGFHTVKHAIRFGAEVIALVGTDVAAAERLAAALAPDLTGRFAHSMRVVSEATFSELAPQAPHTRVMAIAGRPRVDVDAALSSAEPRPVVLLEEPRSLGNMGACVRVAAAADAAAVLTTGPQDPWQPDALRGAAGLHYAIPVAQVTEPALHGRQLVAVDPEGEAFDPVELSPTAVLAFGAERYGLSEQLLARADRRVSVPMRDGVSSLNLATSVAAILFAWRLASRGEAALTQDEQAPGLPGTGPR